MEDCLKSLKITIVAEDSVQYESPLWGQHGISFLLEPECEGEPKKIMVDVGQDFDALMHNMELLNIEPASIDALVLTHCHYDHTRGVSKLLDARGEKELPVIAHPDLFRLHFITNPFIRHVGMSLNDSREELEQKGARFFLTSEPLEIMPGIITTGEVPRTTDFEDAGIALKTIDGDRTVSDEVHDDISIIANIEGKGIVIITGCSHAGIVNISLHALKLCPGKIIDGILGGFHLVEAREDKINKTVKALEDLNPGFVAAGHCTGFGAQVKLLEVFKERFEPLRTGNVYSFPV